MDVLWAAEGPLAVRVVAERLGGELAYTTVMTVLDRLAGKGSVTRHREGRAWLYEAAAPKEAFLAELMRDALDQAGDRGAVLAHFAHMVSEEDAGALRAALRKDSR